MWSQACAAADVAPGGVLYVDIGGTEVLVCNVSGTLHAVGRRCGHVHAPLERGPLDGPYLTCPVHCVQFDVRTGEALNPPVLGAKGGERKPQDDHVEDLPTYQARVRDGMVEVEVPSAG